MLLCCHFVFWFCLPTFSSLLPCEYSNVIDADGSLIYTTTTSFPFFVLNLNMSALCLILSPPLSSSASSHHHHPPSSSTPYDGGFGGKNANYAGIDDVITPIFQYTKSKNQNPTFITYTQYTLIIILIAESKTDGVLLWITLILILFSNLVTGKNL